MMAGFDFTAKPGLGSTQAALSLAWSSLASQPRSLRLVRHLHNVPSEPGEGRVVFDLADLFDSAGTPWSRVLQWGFLLGDGGAAQAELLQCFAAAADTEPKRVSVETHSPPQRWTIEAVSRVTLATSSSAEFGSITTVEIFTESAGGAETLGGTAVISTEPVAAGPISTVDDFTHVITTQRPAPSLFTWTPAGAATLAIPFAVEQDRDTLVTSEAGAALQVDVATGTTLSARFTERANPLSGELDRTLTLTDRDPALQSGVTAYYTAFEDSGAGLVAAASATVLIAGPHGFPARLFELLPSVHQYYDNPASGHGGSWQLQRFLGIFGAALDHARGTADALPSLFDPLTARADYLPNLAQTIGWPLDRTLSTERQRGDILFAPEVFATIGTVPNVQALANRTTGWACRVKEYADNVLLTNAVEPIRLWQIFETDAASPAAGFAPPSIQPDLYPLPAEPVVTQADPSRVDARPAAATGADGTVWLFWHSTRLGAEWQANTAYAAGAFGSILAPQGAGGLTYVCTTAGMSGATRPAFPTAAGADVTDGSAVWTCRGASLPRRRIWLQRLGIDPVPLDVLADLGDGSTLYDETPAVTSVGGTIWLAWASNRGGHQEIWTRSWASPTAPPGLAQQLTHQKTDNRTPALACTGAAGAPIWAAWASTQSGQTMIWTTSSVNGIIWSPPTVASPGPRDRAPAAAFDGGGQLHLFWSADRGVSSQIRRATLAAGAWTTNDVTDASPSLHDEAPAAALWQGSLRLFWHSNRFAAAWQKATAFSLGDFVVPPAGTGLWFECTAAGTSGAAPPAFPTVSDATVLDGEATWTCRGSIAKAPLARRSRIWWSTGPGFAAAAAVARGPANAMQPAAIVAGGALRLFLASQDSGIRFRSRTVDTRTAPAGGRAQTVNALAKTSMGSYADRLHYTYDTRRAPQAVVARDTAALFLSPNDSRSVEEHDLTVQRLRAFLTPFRPVTTRFVYLVEHSAGAGFTPVASDP